MTRFINYHKMIEKVTKKSNKVKIVYFKYYRNDKTYKFDSVIAYLEWLMSSSGIAYFYKYIVNYDRKNKALTILYF